MQLSKIFRYNFLSLAVVLLIASCQKMERPVLGELILDPPPPPYTPLKTFFAFENNTGDSGEAKSPAVASNVTFVTGVNGMAAQFGDKGYVVQTTLSDSVKSPGSFTLAFWMNGVGPVTGGAQGVFAIGNQNEFWGNLELFLENSDNADEAFLKIHMFNANATDGKGEQWSEIRLAGALNKWTHLALTYDSASARLSLYMDGLITSLDKVLDGGNYGGIKFNDVGGMAVGTFAFQTSPSLTNHGPEDWAKSFNGAMDQVRFYNVALAPDAVNTLYVSKE